MEDALIKTRSNGSETFALHHLVRKPQVKTPGQKAIILLHGVGSNEKDLFGLAGLLPDDMYVISPRGQFTMEPGRYAWYAVDFSTGRPVINAGQEASSREVIRTFIREVKTEYDVDEVYLGGFSQGAIMSYSIGLTHPNELEGIISLSGRILSEIRPAVKTDSFLKKLRVFVGHGVQDNMLPVHYAREAKEYLESFGLQPDYHEYQIGHQISSAMLQDLNEWLK